MFPGPAITGMLIIGLHVVVVESGSTVVVLVSAQVKPRWIVSFLCVCCVVLMLYKAIAVVFQHLIRLAQSLYPKESAVACRNGSR